MKTISDWLEEYSRSHRNPVNRLFHFACIPLIVFALMGVLKAVPVGGVWLNAASLAAIATLVWYWMLSWRLALGVMFVFVVLYAGVLALETAAGRNLIWVGLALFALGWIGQLAGHRAEGTRPSFFEDLRFLLIGPLWELAHLYDLLGIAVEERPTAR